MARADGADIFFGEGVAGFHVFHYKKGAAEDTAGLLVFGYFVAYFAEGFLGRSDGFNHRLEFLRLEGKGAVRSGYRTGQCEMLFYDAGT